MFTSQNVREIYRAISVIDYVAGTDVYVFLEDTNEITNLQQRHWDRSNENATFSSDLIVVAIPRYGHDHGAFVLSLWNVFVDLFGIR